jgi:hypothetical protein
LDELIQIYYGAEYYLFYNDKKIQIVPGNFHPEIDEILKIEKSNSFSFITAFNPRSIILTPAENNQRQMNLEKEIQKLNYKYFYGVSRGKDWPDEECIFVLNIQKEESAKLASLFQQRATLFARLEEITEVIDLG